MSDYEDYGYSGSDYDSAASVNDGAESSMEESSDGDFDFGDPGAEVEVEVREKASYKVRGPTRSIGPGALNWLRRCARGERGAMNITRPRRRHTPAEETKWFPNGASRRWTDGGGEAYEGRGDGVARGEASMQRESRPGVHTFPSSAPRPTCALGGSPRLRAPFSPRPPLRSSWSCSTARHRLSSHSL